MAKTSVLTCRQLEERLSQQVSNIYLNQLGHQPHPVSCKLVDKTLTIIIQDSITRPEQLLAQQGNQQLVEQIRYIIQEALQPYLKSVIEDIFAVPVNEILSDFKYNTGHTSIIAILATVPQAYKA